MANALRDGNYVPGALGVDSTNPANVLPFKINPVTGRILAEVSGSITAPHNSLAGIDGNGTIHLSQTELDSLTKTPSVSTTEVASQGGLLINIDSAVGDVATSTGYVEDEKYGVSLQAGASGTRTAYFTSAVKRTGNKTLYVKSQIETSYGLIMNFNGTVGSSTASGPQKYLVPCKPNTKYRLSVWVKVLNNTATLNYRVKQGNASLADVGTSTIGAPLVTTEWQCISNTFTTSASTVYLKPLFETGSSGVGTNVEWYTDVNSMTLEEITEPVTNSLTSKSPSLVGFTAVGSTDNVDQADTTGGTTNAGGWCQKFIPTKSDFAGVVLKKGSINTTTDWTFQIRTDNGDTPVGGTILSSNTVTVATFNGIGNNFEYTTNLPCKLTVGTSYWICWFGGDGSHTFDTTGAYANGYTAIFDGTTKTEWFAKGRDAYFKTLYYKPSTNFTARQNNDVVSISADSDGFLNGMKFDLENGVASFAETFGTQYLQNYTVSGADLVAKVQLPAGNVGGSFVSDKVLTYSVDGVTYSNAIPNNARIIYVKIASYSGITSFSFTIPFDTSSFKTLYNFPTNQNLYATYVKTLATATTTATYRATKYGFPSIEFAENVYTFLKTDTTATGSTVAFSPDGTTYTTVADGANIALTSTTYPIVYVRSNITANRLYVSSNDYNADSAKDGSLKCNVQYKALNQGLIYYVQDLESEVKELKKATSKDYVLVSKSGGDFDNLYEAVASGAKNIFVKNGIYEEQHTFTISNDNVRIKGESREGTIVRFPAGNDGIKVYANDSEINNLTIDTATNGGAAAYVIGDGKAAGSPDYNIGNRNRVIGCTIIGPSYTFAIFVAGAATSSGAQTIGNFNSNLLQEGNVVEDCYLYSTWNGDSFSFSLQKNGSFSRNKCFGGRIALYMTRNCNCSDNIIVESANQGIFIGAPSWDNVVSGNSIYSPASAGIKQQNQLEHPVTGMNALRNAIFGNVIKDAGDIGIAINDSRNCTFSNNVVDTSYGHGIYLQTAAQNVISGNVIRNPNEGAGSVESGIYLVLAVVDNVISGNEIYDDRTGTYKMRGGIVDRETGDCHGNAVTGNVIRGRNTQRSIWIQSNRWTVTGNNVEGGDYAGVRINGGSYNVVSSNVFRNNTNQANNSYGEVWLEGTAVGNTISGNMLLSDATNKAASGVILSGAGVANTWVGFNRIVGNLGTAIDNTGTNTTINALT